MEPSQLRLKEISRKLRYLRYGLLTVLMVLCLFTKPPWCTNLGDTIDDDCIKGPDATTFYRSKFPLFSSKTIGITASLLMCLITLDKFFVYFSLRASKSTATARRRFLAFCLLGLTLTHFLFDIMEQSKAITFRLSEINRALFLMISM